jgi:hypothetical protein
VWSPESLPPQWPDCLIYGGLTPSAGTTDGTARLGAG